jgi:hypothetical protein
MRSPNPLGLQITSLHEKGLDPRAAIWICCEHRLGFAGGGRCRVLACVSQPVACVRDKPCRPVDSRRAGVSGFVRSLRAGDSPSP